MLSPSDEAATAEIPYLHIVLHIRGEESKAEMPPKWTICRETGQGRPSTTISAFTRTYGGCALVPPSASIQPSEGE